MSGFFHKLFGNPEAGEPANGAPQPNGTAGDAPAFSSTRPFSVSELANLLPPEFVRLQGVDVNREVKLELATARRTLADGRPAVMLSEIYAACPEIFPKSIGPDDDFEVRLPATRVRALLGVNDGTQTGAPFQVTQPTPFQTAVPAAASPFQPVESSAASPFQAVEPAPSPFQAVPPAAASPFQAVEPAASPFQASPAASPFQAPSAGTASPFQAVEPVASPFQPVSPAAGSPFQPVDPAVSPFKAIAHSEPPAPTPAAAEPPVSTFPVAGQPVGRFLPEPQRPVEKKAEPAPVFSPFRPVAADPVEVPATERVMPMAPVSGGDEVRFDLADSLKAVSSDILGFSAQHLPGGIECKVPESKVRPGFFPGTGTVTLRDVVSSLPTAYRSVFGAAKLDHELVIPFHGMEEVQPLPDESKPVPEALMTGPIHVSASSGVGSQIFETPFAALAREDAGISAPAASAIPPVESVGPPIGTTSPAGTSPVTPAPLAPLAPLSPLAPEPVVPEPLVQAGPPAPVSTAFRPVLSPVDSAMEDAEPEPLPLAPEVMVPLAETAPENPVPAVAPLAAVEPTTQESAPLAEPVVEPEPVAHIPVAVATPAAGPVKQPLDEDFGMDFRQLELRAVFGLAGVLPRRGVFDLATGLEGISAAGYFEGESLVFGHAPDGVSLAAMPSAFAQLSRMANDIGIVDARALTVQTERGLLAFFSEGQGCLAVLHEGRRFAPGVRERLVIILRELTRGE